MGKCFEQYEEIISIARKEVGLHHMGHEGVNNLYLGMIAGYLATIVDELGEMNEHLAKKSNTNMVR